MTTNDTPSHLLKPRFFSTTKDERTDSAINLGSVDLDDFNKHNLSNSSSSSSLSSSSSSHRAHRLNPRYWPSRPSSLSNYSRPISPTNNIECPSTTTTTKVPSFSSHTIHQPHHISRSLPTSRRNSTDLTSLWSSLDSLNLNPRPAGDIRRKESDDDLIAPHHLRRVSSNDTVCAEKSNRTPPTSTSLIPPPFSGRFMMFEDERLGSGGNTSGATSQLQGLLQSSIPSASTIDDSFPMLFPRDAFPGLLSARSAALDLATLPQTSPRSARMEELNSIYGDQKFGDRFQRQISPPDFATTNTNKSVNIIRTLSSVQETAFRHQLTQPQQLQQQQQQQLELSQPQQRPRNNNSSPVAAAVPPPPQLAPSSSSSSATSVSVAAASLPPLQARSLKPGSFGEMDDMSRHDQVYTTTYQLAGPMAFSHSVHHQQQQQQQTAMPNGVSICRYYIQGYCSKGERCTFAHPPPANISHVNGTYFNAPMSTSVSQPAHQSPHLPPALSSQSSSAGVNSGVGMNHIYAIAGISNSNNASGSIAGNVHQNTSAIPVGYFPPAAGVNALQYQNVNEGLYTYTSIPSAATNHKLAMAMGSSGGGMGVMNHHHHHQQQQLLLQQQQQMQLLQMQQPKIKKIVSDEANRFSGIPFEELLGQLYSLCKDQHGCRYLQKRLEERNEPQLNAIFVEVFPHFVELMTDPFGNYLCQRLLEYCTEEQRTAIAESVANDLVHISLNMHGTRAVQKMIEYLSNTQQVRALIVALSMNVVTLIKDLNGNHVIQKCLNRLTAEQNQFIYNAVTHHCVKVATHRHGCCVLQRCIDHASEAQKKQLVAEITFNALPLVQDPFGNYVVQYVLDLNDGIYADGVIRRFIGNVCILSVQKFSSNVIEKCIRVATVETRKYLIEELLNRDRLDKLIKDSFANYVVQTALDFSDPLQRMQLVECIRPLLTTIRHTPHGKRIYNKINREHPLTPNTILQPTVSNTLVYPNNYMGDKGGGETGHSYHSHQFHPQQYQQSAMYLQL